MTSKWIKYTLKYYTFWGFYSTSSKLTHIFVLIFQAISCIFCTLMGIKTLIQDQELMKLLDAYNIFLYFVFAMSLYWHTIYDSYTYRYEISYFWQIFEKIDVKFQIQNNFKIRYYFIIFIILSVGDCVMYIFATFFEHLSHTNGKTMHFILLNVVDHRLFFYLFHVNVIAFQLKKIEKKFKKLSVTSEFNNELKWFRDYYKLVNEMSNCINNSFAWSNMLMILLFFLTLVTNINFVYRYLINRTLDKFNSCE